MASVDPFMLLTSEHRLALTAGYSAQAISGLKGRLESQPRELNPLTAPLLEILDEPGFSDEERLVMVLGLLWAYEAEGDPEVEPSTQASFVRELRELLRAS